VDLLTTIVLGAYGAYPALAAAYLKLADKIEKKFTELRDNHLAHLEERIKQLEDHKR